MGRQAMGRALTGRPSALRPVDASDHKVDAVIDENAPAVRRQRHAPAMAQALGFREVDERRREPAGLPSTRSIDTNI
jgi:hypothetical protein